MINTELLKEYFPDIYVNDEYIYVENDIYSVLSFLKTRNIIAFDMLTEIIATDYYDFIQLSYRLYSTVNSEFLNVITNVKNEAQSVVDLYKSANFDECEIFDLFGVNFIGNKDLKRLYMPETWQGNPMLKSYVQADERLAWND